MPTMRRNRVPDPRQAPPGSRRSPAICAFEKHAADIVRCARALTVSAMACFVSSKPTVSPLMIPLGYCHIKSFQRASSMEKPWPGGEKRRDGRASHHEAW
jgi:hypothetical protein